MKRLFKVVDAQGNLIMVAPIETVIIAFDLHDGAVGRIKRQAIDEKGVCDIHYNYGRTSIFGDVKILVSVYEAEVV
jgi:hypothetical protein